MAKIDVQIALKRIIELKPEDIDYNFQELLRVIKKILEEINK